MSKTNQKQDILQSKSGVGQKSSSFAERSRDVFSCLDGLEKLKPGSSLYQETPATVSQSLDTTTPRIQTETESFRNRESIYKLTEREESGWPPSKQLKRSRDQWERGRDQDVDFRETKRQSFKKPFDRRKIPDHAKNPQKYTKYSLSDAPNVSDRSNTQTALAFLKELSDRKEQGANLEDPKEEGAKIMFNKPKRNANKEMKSTSDLQESASSAISKRILPEAVVGQSSSFKATSSRKKNINISNETVSSNHDAKPIKKAKTNSAPLSHLMYEDEED